MFTLQKLNVVKIVDTDDKRDQLLVKGFSLVEKPAVKGRKKRGEENDEPIRDSENPVGDQE